MSIEMRMLDEEDARITRDRMGYFRVDFLTNTCEVCDAELVFEAGAFTITAHNWFHAQIEDGSHVPTPTVHHSVTVSSLQDAQEALATGRKVAREVKDFGQSPQQHKFVPWTDEPGCAVCGWAPEYHGGTV